MFSDNIYQIFEVATVIFGTFIVQQFIGGVFDRREKKRYVFLGYAVFCVGLSLLSLLYRAPMILALYTITGVFALSFFFYDGKIVSKIFSSLVFGILMIFADMICAGILSMGGGVNLDEVHSFGMQRAWGIVISKIVQILLVKISTVIIKWKKNEKSTLEIKYILPILLCQIFSLIISNNIFMTAFDVGEIMNARIFILILMILYINIIIFWYYDRITSAHEYKRQKELAETKLDFQKDYYRLLQ